MTGILRLRKHLTDQLSLPAWPAGTRLMLLYEADPRALHTILAEAYANGFGTVQTFEQWWSALAGDGEFDPALVFIAADGSSQPVGLAQCWTSGFVKDIAVVPQWRGKGIGDALLGEVFAAFRRRGLPYVDLKVVAANAAAISLYRRAGMVDAPL